MILGPLPRETLPGKETKRRKPELGPCREGKNASARPAKARTSRETRPSPPGGNAAARSCEGRTRTLPQEATGLAPRRGVAGEPSGKRRQTGARGSVRAEATSLPALAPGRSAGFRKGLARHLVLEAGVKPRSGSRRCCCPARPAAAASSAFCHARSRSLSSRPDGGTWP